MHPGDPDDLNGAGGDILERVRAFFEKKTTEAEQHGVNKICLCFDPGIGFGKTNEEKFRAYRKPEKILRAGYGTFDGGVEKTRYRCCLRQPAV